MSSARRRSEDTRGPAPDESFSCVLQSAPAPDSSFHRTSFTAVDVAVSWVFIGCPLQVQQGCRQGGWRACRGETPSSVRSPRGTIVATGSPRSVTTSESSAVTRATTVGSVNRQSPPTWQPRPRPLVTGWVSSTPTCSGSQSPGCSVSRV